MSAGKKRHKINLQRKSAGRDDYGGEDITWQTYATVWAEIRPMTGRELFLAQQISAELTIEVKIRYRSGVLPEHRAMYGTRIFEINAVKNIEERNRELILLCREVA